MARGTYRVIAVTKTGQRATFIEAANNERGAEIATKSRPDIARVVSVEVSR